MSNEAPKTRLKGTKTTRPCVACGKTKDRFKDFKPRWSRCAKHRIKGQKGDPNCTDCQKLVNGNTRQPRCIECDSKRATKKAITVAATPVTAPAPEPVTVATVAVANPEPVATPVTAPAPEVAPTPVVAVEPAPEPVALVTQATVAESIPAKAAKKRPPSRSDLAKALALLDDDALGVVADEEPTTETASPL